MNESSTSIKRALISVSDKTGIVEFAQALHQLNIEILSTGGTCQLLRKAHIPVIEVSQITKFPEMMDGRVKTLHPKIHGGILGLRDQHQAIAETQHIPWIDLVVVNLYPFVTTIQQKNVSFDEAIENIDIGGPAMIRSAAKNMGWVSVLVDPHDYENFLNEIKKSRTVAFSYRKKLAEKAFAVTAQYDQAIFNYLTGTTQNYFSHCEKKNLRYGENPHQKAEAILLPQQTSILTATQHQGKELSYNNIADADAALECVREFNQPACVIVKHANPCGVAYASHLLKAFELAYAADSVSAFGGIIALNNHCTTEIAARIMEIFFEVIIAPSFSIEALNLFCKKPNLRVISYPFADKQNSQTYRSVEGAILVQDKDLHELDPEKLQYVTKRYPDEKELQDLLFSWRVVKHIKSNAIVIAKNHVTYGIGAGQVSRIDAVELAFKKAKITSFEGCVLASDGFFPFRDSIDYIAHKGIKAIIQPGGGIRDTEVIAACDEKNIAMIFTGMRCFKH